MIGLGYIGTTEKLAEWLAEQRPDLRFPKQQGDTTDIVIHLVDHEEFKQVDQDLLKEKIIFDLRGMWR